MIDFLYNSQYHHRNGTIAIALAIIRKKQQPRMSYFNKSNVPFIAYMHMNISFGDKWGK